MVPAWEGRLRLPTPHGGTRPGLGAPAYGICICLVYPIRAPGGALEKPGFAVSVPVRGTCPTRHSGDAHPLPVLVCINRGEWYQPVDATRLDLGVSIWSPSTIIDHDMDVERHKLRS